MRFIINELIFVATICDMADDKTLISSSEIELAAVMNRFQKELDSLRNDITLICSEIASLTVLLDDESHFSFLQFFQKKSHLIISLKGHLITLTTPITTPHVIKN